MEGARAHPEQVLSSQTPVVDGKNVGLSPVTESPRVSSIDRLTAVPNTSEISKRKEYIANVESRNRRRIKEIEGKEVRQPFLLIVRHETTNSGPTRTGCWKFEIYITNLVLVSAGIRLP